MTADISDITSYDWIVSTTRNLSNGNVFFFQVRNASNLSDQDEIFASHYFNITENLSATTASSSASSSKGATLEGTAGTSVSSPTATKAHPILSTRTASTETGSSSKYGGLSLGAKIGLGAGAETVFTLILAGGLYLCFRKRTLGPNPANNSRLPDHGGQTKTSLRSAGNSQTFIYGQPHRNHAVILKPQITKGPMFLRPPWVMINESLRLH